MSKKSASARLGKFFKKIFLKAIESSIRLLPMSLILEVRSGMKIAKPLDYESQQILLNIESITEYDLRLHSCKKEPDTVAWIESFIKSGDVLFDVGANVGAYSLVAAKFFDRKVRIYSFEPAFINFSQLCANIHLNNCDETIVPLPIGLSDRTSIERFNYRRLEVGSALHALGESVDERGEPFDAVMRQAVVSYRIDDLIKHLGLPQPNHLKIDVDGIELAVLRGASETLASSSVRSLDIEMAVGDKENQITAFLEAKGFRVHSKYKRKTPGIINCIYVGQGYDPSIH
jgi:FkbM family methyltransferase